MDEIQVGDYVTCKEEMVADLTELLLVLSVGNGGITVEKENGYLVSGPIEGFEKVEEKPNETRISDAG